VKVGIPILANLKVNWRKFLARSNLVKVCFSLLNEAVLNKRQVKVGKLKRFEIYFDEPQPNGHLMCSVVTLHLQFASRDFQILLLDAVVGFPGIIPKSIPFL
jgi:hypothetical protein